MNPLFRTEAAAEEFRTRYLHMLMRWPVPNEHLTLGTCAGNTFVVASGPKDAPPLILLHGALANSAVWMDDIPNWSKDHRVYAVDVIGEPGLSAPSRPMLNSQAHTNWLDDVMRGLELGHAAFVGVSLGGWLALDFAIRRTRRVDRLALLCPGGVGRQKPSLFLKVLPLMLLGLKQKARAVALGYKGEMPAEFADFLDFVHDNFRPRYANLPVFSDEALQRLTMPVLAIVGDRDAFFRSGETKQRLEAIGATVRMVPDCGHLILGQGETIAAFLRQ